MEGELADDSKCQDHDVPVVADTEDLKDIINQSATEYSKYINIETSDERRYFADSVEQMLTQLDEYCGLLDIIRSDTSLCLQQNVLEIEQHSKHMEKIFSRIDQLEGFVKVVKHNVDTMEREVEGAENKMGAFSSVRKAFHSISLPKLFTKKTASSKPTVINAGNKYKSPAIFSTDTFLDTSASDDDQKEVTPEVSSQHDAKSHAENNNDGAVPEDDCHVTKS